MVVTRGCRKKDWGKKQGRGVGKMELAAIFYGVLRAGFSKEVMFE